MFSIHDFIMSCLHGMVHFYADFQVREYALNWYEKGKLNEEDLAQVENWLVFIPEPVDNLPNDEPVDEPIDEPVDEPIDEPVEDEPIDEPIDEPVDESSEE